MIKSGLLFFVIIALSAGGCLKPNIPVPLTKVEYTGNQLRTDGYYYSVDEDYLYLTVLYRDGFCIHTYTKQSNVFGLDTLNYIEKRLQDNNYISKLMEYPYLGIGIFIVKNTDIEIEVWNDPGNIMGGGRMTTFSRYGKILNDTTFHVHKGVDNKTNKTYTEDLTYHFVKYDSKPDSTNHFVNSNTRPKLPRI